MAINNLMEDTATVEICRAQIWQWIHHSAKLLEGPTITRELFRTVLKQEIARITKGARPPSDNAPDNKTAGELLDTLVTSDSFPEFMTSLAYDSLK